MKGKFDSVAALTILIFALGSLYGATDSALPVESALESGLQKAQAAVNPESEPKDFFYTVQPGDSLYKIARMYNVTVAALKTSNNLKGTLIQVGQKFRIPLLPDTTIGATLTYLDEAFLSPDGLSSEPIRVQLAKVGLEMLGIRYRRGGAKESGFDCSGLVKNLFARFNIDLPRSSRQQYRQGEKVDRDKLEIGDLVFFSYTGKQPNHVGIYLGENKFLHAAVKAGKVVVSDLNKAWYAVRYIGARRITDLWKDEQTPESKGE